MPVKSQYSVRASRTLQGVGKRGFASAGAESLFSSTNHESRLKPYDEGEDEGEDGGEDESDSCG
jgi:hypothetical protein